MYQSWPTEGTFNIFILPLQRPLVPPFRDREVVAGMGPNHLCEVHLPAGTTSSGGQGRGRKMTNFFQSWLSKFPTRSKRIDVIARITFPLVFALFNIAYWCAYLYPWKVGSWMNSTKGPITWSEQSTGFTSWTDYIVLITYSSYSKNNLWPSFIRMNSFGAWPTT